MSIRRDALPAEALHRIDVLERLGDDAEARYHFFKRFVALAKEVTGRSEGEQGPRSN